MNMNKKEDLIEQYEDAAFALMMSEYAEQEGNRLLQEFEEDKARGDVPAVPVELDAKCRNLIRKAYEKEKNEERIKKFLRFTGRTAAIWFATIGICATLVLSVEALRTPVINFIVEHHEKFTTIHLGKEPSSDSSTQSTSGNQSTVQGETPLDGILGNEYSIAHYTVRNDGTFAAYYQNKASHQVMLSCTIGDGTLNIDSDCNSTRPITICGYNGCLVEENNRSTIFWFNTDQNLTYQLRATHTNVNELWTIATGYILKVEGES